MNISAPNFIVRASQDTPDTFKRKLHIMLEPTDRVRGTILRFRRTGHEIGDDGVKTLTIDVIAEFDESACTQPDSYTIPYHVGEDVSQVKIRLRGDADQDFDLPVKSLACLM